MKRAICCLLAILMLLTFAGCAQEPDTTSADTNSDTKTSLADMSNAKIGVVTGSMQAIILPQMLPDAQFQEYNSTTDAAMALSSGKIDAFSTEESVFLAMLWEGQKFDRIEEPVAVSEYGVMFGKGRDLALQQEFDQFLTDFRESGALEELDKKWFSSREPLEFLDPDGLTGENGTLRIAINSSQKPFAYVKNGKYAGFDVEMLILFAQEYGYQLDIDDASFGGILTGIDQGTYDIAASGVTITEERKESVDYSDVYHTDDLVLVINSTSAQSSRSLADFNDATLGVIDGSIYAGYSRELFPDAEVDSYSTFTDLLQCVKQGKIDGFLLDLPNFNALKRTEPELSYITIPGHSVQIGYAVGKDATGTTVRTQMNQFLQELEANGTAAALWDKWCDDTEPTEPPVIPDLSGNETVLSVAVDLSRKPFVYMLNSQYAGYEIEVLYQFCEKYGYGIEFTSAQWTSGVAGLRSENGEGKYDMLACGIYITEERKESVDFTDPYLTADVVMVTYGADEETDILASIAESFEKTFIREDRWKLIVQGLGTTLLISFFAVLSGTLLGSVLYLLTRAKNKVISAIAVVIARIYSRIIAGTPALVILMLLFYVIFGSVDISGTVVSIFGFMLIFGSFVYAQLALTVAGVDHGQTEAAYALGYSRNRTFFRIVLPQALKTFMPTYTAEVVGLIKATSVVGYIAVSDLTKMGDIIRSSTYEAFFPLLAVAVIYFFITWLIAELLGVLGRRFEPKKRKNKNILKGVVR